MTAVWRSAPQLLKTWAFCSAPFRRGTAWSMRWGPSRHLQRVGFHVANYHFHMNPWRKLYRRPTLMAKLAARIRDGACNRNPGLWHLHGICFVRMRSYEKRKGISSKRTPYNARLTSSQTTLKRLCVASFSVPSYGFISFSSKPLIIPMSAFSIYINELQIKVFVSKL